MARPEHFDFVIKLVLIGDSSTGKTAASRRYTDNIFTSTVTSTGIDYKNKMVHYKNRVIKVQVWDTAGQERFRCITSHFFRGASGVMIFYDITCRLTFSNVSSWLDSINRSDVPDNVEIMLVGCKCDLEHKRTVQTHEGEKLAKEFGISFYEISSKTGLNVEECFSKMVVQTLTSVMSKRNHAASIVEEKADTQQTVNLESTSTKKSCCSNAHAF